MIDKHQMASGEARKQNVPRKLVIFSKTLS